MAEFIIAKHRNGSVEDVKLRFIKEQAKFTNWDNVGGMPQPGMEQYEMQEAAAYTMASASSLQSATSNEFDISRVTPSNMDEVPF